MSTFLGCPLLSQRVSAGYFGSRCAYAVGPRSLFFLCGRGFGFVLRFPLHSSLGAPHYREHLGRNCRPVIGGLHPHRAGLVRLRSLVGHDSQRATVIFVRLSSKARRWRGEPEYRINSNAFVGGAFDYSNPKARLFNNAGTTDVNSFQLGIYGAWADAHFFAQGLATFG
jgi:hypothetical protein